MRQFIISFLILITSTPAFACKLSIPESYVPTFLNPPVSGHYAKCEDLPEEKCHCVESIDPWTTDLIDGELIPNPDKKFARELKEKRDGEEHEAKKERKKSFSFKGGTIKELREEMNAWLEMQK